MNRDVQMMKFEVRTYENVCSFPEITIETTISLGSLEQITNIDLDVLKKNILQTVALQAVQLKKVEQKEGDLP